MSEKVTKMHEYGHFMIKVLTAVCGFMATLMTAAIFWGASTLNGLQISMGVIQEQMKTFNQQVEFLRAEMRDTSTKGYTMEAAANDKKMMELQIQMISNRVGILEGRKIETMRAGK